MDKSEFDLLIRPDRNLLNFRLRELWAYRDLIVLLFRRDFVAVYKQTLIGPLWFFVQPLMTSLVFTLVFGKIAGISTDGIPAFAFYLTGTVVWSYFSECISKSANVFISNANIFTKVYFPRLAVPIASLMTSSLKLLVQLGLLLAVLLYYHFTEAGIVWNIRWLFAPIILVYAGLMGTFTGLFISAFTISYRDLTHLVGFGVQLLMYATPVIYPITLLPEAMKPFALLNPATLVVESFRYVMLGVGHFEPMMFISSFTYFALISLSSLIFFNWVEKNFVDKI